MSNSINNSGSLPFHMAQAYGIKPRPTPPVRPQQQQQVQTPTRAADQASLSTPSLKAAASAASAMPSPKIQKLSAGVVPGGVAFDANGTAAPSRNPYAMYSHPADVNSAATGVQLGARLDTSG